MAHKLALALDGATVDAEVVTGTAGTRVRLGERWHDVEMVPTGHHGLYSLLINGRSWEVYAQPRPGGWDLLVGNRVFSVDSGPAAAASRRRAQAEHEGVWLLRSPLAGIVAEVRVAPGDDVQAGQVLLVVESMKMNNEMTAGRSGRVSAVHVRPGDRIDRGAALVQVE
jgi:biotin carboxyl carrier protein